MDLLILTFKGAKKKAAGACGRGKSPPHQLWVLNTTENETQRCAVSTIKRRWQIQVTTAPRDPPLRPIPLQLVALTGRVESAHRKLYSKEMANGTSYLDH